MKHFFDIGGNKGQTFDWLRTLSNDCRDHIFWIFEPSPRHHEQLIKKCSEMSEKYNIKLCPFGIGETTGTKLFYEKDDLLGDSFEDYIASDHEVHNIRQGYDVISAIISLPEFILQYTNINDEIILDIDAEGSEFAILESLIKNQDALIRVKKIIVEFHYINNTERFMTREQIESKIKKANIDLTIRGY